MFAIEIIIENSLYAVKYTNYRDEFENNEYVLNYEVRNEFNRLFINWQDPEYLDGFFSKHIDDLQNGFYNFSIENAIQKTIDDAYSFQQKLLLTAQKGKDNFYENLQTLFVPLNNYEKEIYPPPDCQESKAYANFRSWLRIYAIRIEPNVFVITGGAIKLTKTMNEREHLKKELKKLSEIKQFLILEGIIDNDSIVDFFELEI